MRSETQTEHMSPLLFGLMTGSMSFRALFLGIFLTSLPTGLADPEAGNYAAYTGDDRSCFCGQELPVGDDMCDHYDAFPVSLRWLKSAQFAGFMQRSSSASGRWNASG